MTKPITQQQLDALERAVDKVFGRLGIDVEFTRHFLDRVNDERNRKQITIQELGNLFAKEYKRWGRAIAGMPINSQAVMKDLSSEINIPFVLNPDDEETDLVAKTVMRKKNFKTPNRELPVESVNEADDSEIASKFEKQVNQSRSNSARHVKADSVIATSFPGVYQIKANGNVWTYSENTNRAWKSRGYEREMFKLGPNVKYVSAIGPHRYSYLFAIVDGEIKQLSRDPLNAPDLYNFENDYSSADITVYNNDIRHYKYHQLNQKTESADISEKAKSKAQQRFMGMVHAAQQGEEPASKEVAKVAKSMKKSDAEDYASTKHKGKPEHVKEESNKTPEKLVKQAQKYLQNKAKDGLDSVALMKKGDDYDIVHTQAPAFHKMPKRGWSVVAYIEQHGKKIRTDTPHRYLKDLAKKDDLEETDGKSLNDLVWAKNVAKPGSKRTLPKQYAPGDKVKYGTIVATVVDHSEPMVTLTHPSWSKDRKVPDTSVKLVSKNKDDLEEKHGAKRGKQVKGKSKTPKKTRPTTGGSSPHPMRGKLVGEDMDQPPLDVETLSVRDIAKLHGVDPAKIQRELEMGIEVELEHSTDRSAATEIALDHLKELPDYYTQLATIEPHHYDENAIKASWESYQQLDELVEPDEAILQKALRYLDQKVKNNAERQSLAGYAYDVTREINLGGIASAKELAQLYRDWKGENVVTEGWMEKNLYYLDEVIEDDKRDVRAKSKKKNATK